MVLVDLVILMVMVVVSLAPLLIDLWGLLEVGLVIMVGLVLVVLILALVVMEVLVAVALLVIEEILHLAILVALVPMVVDLVEVAWVQHMDVAEEDMEVIVVRALQVVMIQALVLVLVDLEEGCMVVGLDMVAVAVIIPMQGRYVLNIPIEVACRFFQFSEYSISS